MTGIGSLPARTTDRGFVGGVRVPSRRKDKRDDESEFVPKAVEVGLGIIATVISWKASKPNDPVEMMCAIMMGMLTTIFASVIWERQSRRVKRVHQRFGDVLGSIKNCDFDQLLLVLSHIREVVASDEMNQVWIDLVWRARKRFRATSYVHPRYFENAYRGILLQDLKADFQHVQIERVFVLDSIDELRHIVELNKNLRKIQNRYILKEDFSKHAALRGPPPETIDFGIFDDKCTFLWSLDAESREPTGGRVEFSRSTAEEYGKYFNNLWNNSYDLPKDIKALNDAVRAVGGAKDESIRSNTKTKSPRR